MAMKPPEEIQITTPYLRLAARVWGPEHGLRVLAIHGWLDNAASFDQLAPLLPHCRLVALDLPGHGFSEHRPSGAHYHFIDFVPDVLSAATALGWDRFALLGHSLGASIASFAAAIAPERVGQLALIEGLGPLSGKPADSPAVLQRSMTQLAQLAEKGLPLYASLEEAVQARSTAGQLSREAAATLAGRGTKPVQTGISWRSDPKLTLTSPLYLTEEQVLAFLAHIEAPTLLICGESGYLVKREFMAERYKRVPQLELKMLPGGHHLHMETPESTAHVLAQFFRSQQPRSAVS